MVETNLKVKLPERIPVQATTYGEDGVPVQLFLHVVEGKINELEIVKADNSPIKKVIEAKDLHIDKIQRL